jgi:hypothetical protein
LRLAQHDHAKRHSRNGANELRGNPAGKGDPGGAEFRPLLNINGGFNGVHHITFGAPPEQARCHPPSQRRFGETGWAPEGFFGVQPRSGASS